MHKSYKKTVAILVTCALMGALLCFPVSAASTDTSSSLGGVTIQGASLTRYFGFWESSGTDITVSTDGTSLMISATNVDGWGANANAYFKCDFVLYFNNLSASDTSNISFDVVLNSYTGDPSYYVTTNYSTMSKLSGGVTTTATKVTDNHLKYTLNGTSGNSFKVSTSFSQSSGTGYIYRIYIKNIKIDTVGAQDIIDNQNANTDKEIQAEKDLYEQEKQENQEVADEALEGADSIPNDSDGFIDALGLFVSTMSTTDTDCSLTFPAIKIPSFAGMPAVTLSEEKEVDFEAAINLIPSDILSLVQALTTIALIVFCFKELYDTISEALTRKKANSDG